MCGGRGTRLDSPVEKPLFEVNGRPMVDRVRSALANSHVETVHAAVSPNTPETRAHVDGDLPIVETPGDGYVADLGHALDAIGRPALTVAADLPLLAPECVNTVLDVADRGSLAVCVPAARKRKLEVSVGTTFRRGDRELAPTGVNVVGEVETETVFVTDDDRFVVNVNRCADATIAEEML